MISLRKTYIRSSVMHIQWLGNPCFTRRCVCYLSYAFTCACRFNSCTRNILGRSDAEVQEANTLHEASGRGWIIAVQCRESSEKVRKTHNKLCDGRKEKETHVFLKQKNSGIIRWFEAGKSWLGFLPFPKWNANEITRPDTQPKHLHDKEAGINLPLPLKIT